MNNYGPDAALQPAPPDQQPSKCRVMTLRLCNILGFLVVCTINALGATGRLTGNAVGDLARENSNYILPASSAFSIWGLIYAMNAAFLIYQALPKINSDKVMLFSHIGWWYVISCVTNSAWIVAFTVGTEFSIWLSTFLIFFLAVSLITIYVRSGGWNTRRASCLEFFVVDVTFSLYLGWVTVASILNVATAYVASGKASGAPWTAEGWACFVLGLAATIYLLALRSRGDGVFALVFSWAAVGIAQQERQEGVALPPSDMVAATAATLAAVVGAMALIELAYGAQQHYRLSHKEEGQVTTPWLPRVRRGSSLQDALM